MLQATQVLEGRIEAEDQEEKRQHVACGCMTGREKREVNKDQSDADAADELNQGARQFAGSHRAHEEVGDTLGRLPEIIYHMRLEVIALDDAYAGEGLMHDLGQVRKVGMDGEVGLAKLAAENH